MFSRLRLCTLLSLGLLSGVASTRAAQITVPMTAQINLGLGDVIGSAAQIQNNGITFESEGGVGFTRLHLVSGNGMNSYYFGPTVDLTRLGVGPIDLSSPDARLQVDVRYYRDPNGYAPGTTPDAPIGLLLQSASGSRQITWPYRVYQGDPLYPTWTHLNLDPNTPAPPNVTHTDSGTFDVSNVTALSFWGTNWGGKGDDFIDVKQLVIRTSADATPVPEPGGLTLACLGSILWLATARYRRSGR